MKKEYLSAPLPFVGQKRMFAKEFKRVLKQFDDTAVFVDLFGGSGLLSHITRFNKPGSRVIYNDYDNYRARLENIPQTNALLAELRILTTHCTRHKPIPEEVCEAIIKRIEQEENAGFVDYITISTSLLFSMKYALNLESLRKERFYNTVRKSDYACEGYLDGIEVVRYDYKELFLQYKNCPNVIFLVDPPYLGTEVGTYTMSWRLADYLDVLTILGDSSFVYFTSNKSGILELCQWIGENKITQNPFRNAEVVEFNAHMNYNSHYTDIMLYKKQESDFPCRA